MLLSNKVSSFFQIEGWGGAGKDKGMKNPNLNSFQNNLNDLIHQQVHWWVLGESSPICVFSLT